MRQRYTGEVSDDGNRIQCRIEESGLIRTIHLADRPAPASKTTLEYSVGHWEGNVRIVSTSAMLSTHFNAFGILLSDAADVEERFELSEDEARLDYQLIITDPATFTEPVTLERYWLWRPGETIKPFECVESLAFVESRRVVEAKESRS